MEGTLTVTEVTRTFGVSARMLRHYEKLGLLSSDRKEDYSYRIYRPEDLRRLRQILVLRKLRVSLKEIGDILNDPGSAAAIGVFEKNLSQMDDEIRSLQAVRSVIEAFLRELKRRQLLPAGKNVLLDSQLLDLADALSPASPLIQEERKKTMENLKQADPASRKLRDVRIVHLPGSDVAAAHFVGDDPENRAGEMISDFVRAEKLWEKHPGLRLYGFNHPSPMDESGFHGYEFWITIPDGLEVPPPLEKKHFAGGTYAAHMIPMGNFEEWEWLYEWVQNSDEYEYAGNGSPENMFDNLEEHLNYHDHILETHEGEPQTAQLDLLIPVRRKTKDCSKS